MQPALLDGPRFSMSCSLLLQVPGRVSALGIPFPLPGALIIPFPLLLLLSGIPRMLGMDPLDLQQGEQPRFHPGGEILKVPSLLVLFYPAETLSLNALSRGLARERCRGTGVI